MYPLKNYKSRLWCSIQIRRIVPSLNMLCLGIGLIGHAFAVPFFLGFIGIIYFVDEIRFFIKHREIRDDCLRHLFYENKVFLKELKRMMLVTVALGVIANVLLLSGMKIVAGWVLFFWVIYSLVVYIRLRRLYE